MNGSTNTTPVPPYGCGQDVPELYWNLCDLELLWGVIAAGFAALGVVLSVIFTIVLSCCLKRLTR